MNASGVCTMLQVGSAKLSAPPAHSWSRAADYIDSQARCLLAASGATQSRTRPRVRRLRERDIEGLPWQRGYRTVTLTAARAEAAAVK
jgi:hypothetical protein